MKTIYLQKIKQHNDECFIGKIDPRELIKVVTEVGMGEVQDAQRPLSEKRVKEIAKYVSENSGILPNTLTLATKNSNIQVNEIDKKAGIYAINFPETKDEYTKFADSIDVMDGQHRLYSFLDDTRLIQDDEPFEIGFTLYILPTLEKKRKIFVSCNEKQEKVSSNLLLWFREKLKMLSQAEKDLYNLVDNLNKEYPLKGKIIMSAERISGGFKAKEVMNIIKTAKINELTSGKGPLDEEQIIKVITTYLTAWEDACEFKFTDRPADVGAAVKISGLRYMLSILPTFWNKAVANREPFTKDYCKNIIQRYISSKDINIERSIFFKNETTKKWFADRTATAAAVEQAKAIINSLGSEEFDPLANI